MLLILPQVCCNHVFSHVNIRCTYKNMHLSSVLVDYTHANDVPTMQYYLLHYLTILNHFFLRFSSVEHIFQAFRDDDESLDERLKLRWWRQYWSAANKKECVRRSLFVRIERY